MIATVSNDSTNRYTQKRSRQKDSIDKIGTKR